MTTSLSGPSADYHCAWINSYTNISDATEINHARADDKKGRNSAASACHRHAQGPAAGRPGRVAYPCGPSRRIGGAETPSGRSRLGSRNRARLWREPDAGPRGDPEIVRRRPGRNLSAIGHLRLAHCAVGA